MKKVLDLSVKKSDYSNLNILVVKTKWNEEVIKKWLMIVQKSSIKLMQIFRQSLYHELLKFRLW